MLHLRQLPLSEPQPEHGDRTDDMAARACRRCSGTRPAPACATSPCSSLRFLQDALDPRAGAGIEWTERALGRLAGSERLLGEKEHLRTGTAVSRSDDHLIRHLATNGTRTSDAATLTVAEGDGIRGVGRLAEVLERPHPDDVAAPPFWPTPLTPVHAISADTPAWPGASAASPTPTLRSRSDDRRWISLDRPVILGTDWTSWMWLVVRETELLATSRRPPSEVRGPDDRGPGSTNSPLRWRHLADACAWRGVDGDERWMDGITVAGDPGSLVTMT